MSTALKFLLADDHGLFRDSVAVWLKQLDQGLHIDFAGTQQEVESALKANHYNLLILDLGMPGMKGAYSVRGFCQQLRSTPLIVVSADENPIVIRSCIEAGASGYVTKSSDGESILLAVKQVLAGAEYIPLCARTNKNDAHFDFNEKQTKMLCLLAEGLSNKEIAEKMFLTEGTVKQYVSRLLRILDVDNRMQAGLKARELLGITQSGTGNS